MENVKKAAPSWRDLRVTAHGIKVSFSETLGELVDREAECLYGILIVVSPGADFRSRNTLIWPGTGYSEDFIEWPGYWISYEGEAEPGFFTPHGHVDWAGFYKEMEMVRGEWVREGTGSDYSRQLRFRP